MDRGYQDLAIESFSGRTRHEQRRLQEGGRGTKVDREKVEKHPRARVKIRKSANEDRKKKVEFRARGHN